MHDITVTCSLQPYHDFAVTCSLHHGTATVPLPERQSGAMYICYEMNSLKKIHIFSYPTFPLGGHLGGKNSCGGHIPPSLATPLLMLWIKSVIIFFERSSCSLSYKINWMIMQVGQYNHGGRTLMVLYNHWPMVHMGSHLVFRNLRSKVIWRSTLALFFEQSNCFFYRIYQMIMEDGQYYL